MIRRSAVFTSVLAISLSAVGTAHAQTPGQIPVFVDTFGTLGDSTIAQDSNGNTSMSNSTDNNPVLAVTNTSSVGGLYNPAVFGQSANGTGVYGQSSGYRVSGVYGENMGNGGIGVAGRANTTSGNGVLGVSDNGIGVHAVSTNGWGLLVEGEAEFVGYVLVAGVQVAGSTAVCRNGAGFLSTCSSSLRYKTDVQSFAGGLDIVKRLRPIAFTWKQDGKHDIGLGAEEVEQVEPLLTFRNDKGEIEGVKYNQLSAVFVNAFVEQQAQIKQQQQQIDALKALVCQSHPDAGVCQ